MAKAWWRDSDYELFDRLTKERDEARAEVERLTRERDEARRIANDAVRELNRANVHAWLEPEEPTP